MRIHGVDVTFFSGRSVTNTIPSNWITKSRCLVKVELPLVSGTQLTSGRIPDMGEAESQQQRCRRQRTCKRSHAQKDTALALSWPRRSSGLYIYAG